MALQIVPVYSWIEFATPLPKEFIEKSNDLISSNLPCKEREIQRATRLILDYELLYWNTIYEYSTRI